MVFLHDPEESLLCNEVLLNEVFLFPEGLFLGGDRAKSFFCVGKFMQSVQVCDKPKQIFVGDEAVSEDILDFSNRVGEA